NTFLIPKILFNPSFILSPYVFLLGLMFTNDIFLISSLTLEHLSQLDIRPRYNILKLLLKLEIAYAYVFRQYTLTLTR
ncbi:hypothetical protein K469DRAFT_595696, partial [Zopfia rhizophila CBS 207.26]